MKLKISEKICQPDPYVIKHKNKYYMYVTNSKGVYAFSSDDKFNWKEEGFCLKIDGFEEFWAPSIIEIDNVFYLYVSCVKVGEEDQHKQSLIVAVSDNPIGPFKKHNDLVKPFSIDSHVVKSGDNLYLFYSTNDYDAERAGTLIVCDKMKNPFEVCGNPKVVLRPTLDEEIYMKNRFRIGQHWHTLEGAFYFRKGDYHYILFSGNCYLNKHYYIGYAVCKSKSNDLTELTFEKYPDKDTYYPLVSKNDFEEGTGHCSLLEEDGKYYLYYHGRDYSDKKQFKECRTARIARIEVDGWSIKVVER